MDFWIFQVELESGAQRTVVAESMEQVLAAKPFSREVAQETTQRETLESLLVPDQITGISQRGRAHLVLVSPQAMGFSSDVSEVPQTPAVPIFRKCSACDPSRPFCSGCGHRHDNPARFVSECGGACAAHHDRQTYCPECGGLSHPGWTCRGENAE